MNNRKEDITIDIDRLNKTVQARKKPCNVADNSILHISGTAKEIAELVSLLQAQPKDDFPPEVIITLDGKRMN